MQKWMLVLAVPVLAVALALSAVTLGPGLLQALSPAPAQATSIAVPTWQAGDTWTYNLTWVPGIELANETPLANGMEPQSIATPLVVGQLTKTVVGTVSTPAGDAYNVSLEATFGFAHPWRTDVEATSPLHAVNVTGYAWYLTSNLAEVMEVRTVSMNATWTFFNRTWTMAYSASVTTRYTPALDMWSFPLTANESWNVTSMASIQYAARYSVEGPNMTYAMERTLNVTTPVGFDMQTGNFTNVTTPAGTFWSLGASAFPARAAPPVADHDAEMALNLTDHPILREPHAFVHVWFSAQAGNVVQAEFGPEWAPHLLVTLVAYTLH